MLRFQILIILLLLSILCFAQTIRFNKLYLDTIPTMRNVVVSDTGYVMLGGGGDTRLYILTCFLDSLGNLKNKKYIVKNNNYLFHGIANSLIKTNDGNFLLAGSQVNDFNHSGLLIKLNSSFDTIWTKRNLVDTTISIFYNCIQYSDTNYFAIGATNRSGNSNVLLANIDTSGNLLWYKQYGGFSTDYGFKIIKSFDNGLLFGGWSQSFYPNLSGLYCGEWYLVKINDKGFQQWQNHYGNPMLDDHGIAGLISTKDSCYIAAGGYNYENIGPTTNHFRGRIVKFNRSLVTLWDKQFLQNGTSTYVSELIELQNGDLLVIGSVSEAVMNYSKAVLLKFNSNGILIWQREYRSKPINTNYNNLEVVKQTSDGGFFLAGTVFFYDSTEPSQQMWAVKTDCKGYDKAPVANFNSLQNQTIITCFNTSQNVDSCFWDFGDASPLLYTTTTDTVLHSYADTGTYVVTLTVYNGCTILDNDTVKKTVHIAGTSIEYQEWLERTVSIFPNPAKENVTISMLDYEQAEFSMFNIKGKKMFSQNAIIQNTLIDLSNFEYGVYVIKIQTPKGLLVRKLVKD